MASLSQVLLLLVSLQYHPPTVACIAGEGVLVMTLSTFDNLSRVYFYEVIRRQNKIFNCSLLITDPLLRFQEHSVGSHSDSSSAAVTPTENEGTTPSVTKVSDGAPLTLCLTLLTFFRFFFPFSFCHAIDTFAVN